MTEPDLVVNRHTIDDVLARLVDETPGFPRHQAESVREDAAAGECEIAFDWLVSWLIDEYVPLAPSYFRRLEAVADYLGDERSWYHVACLRDQVQWDGPPPERADPPLSATTAARVVLSLIAECQGLEGGALRDALEGVDAGDPRAGLRELVTWIEVFETPTTPWFLRNALRVAEFYHDNALSERLAALTH
ncbi:DUF6189 family protein [Actinokineospora diospyrosa]|uniref:Uncharacterized protein n=1 Tax=Actinokineospora diospyrosa TaxID=103728 RepID=A0ABT1I8D8_9PSEU|nr:DUF6189 family protein [Actinokineospora diospyrosa]MCP2268848.1 hypothetical protein [Actinokineospora diospyrosa]